VAFYITIANGLLEPKHVKAMGEAVWLYMWLQDKNTSINENGIGKVLGNKPISFEDVSPDLGMSSRTYRRWVERLRDAGYINTIRTPYGLVITINKAKKPLKKRSAISDTSKKLNRDVPHMADHKRDVPNSARDVPKMSKDVPHMADLIKTIQDNTIDNTSSTNVLGDEPPKRYGKPEINELFDYWEEMVGHPITSNIKGNRAAASNLLKKHGRDAVRKMIGGVAYSHGEKYAPTIANFSQLQSKWDELIIWGKKHKSRGSKGRIYKV
jgi:hypothetical protein